MKFKKLQWIGDDPKGVIQSYTKVFDKYLIGFRIMTTANNGLNLVNFNVEPAKFIPVNSVDEAKEIAQLIFEKMCERTITDIIE